MRWKEKCFIKGGAPKPEAETGAGGVTEHRAADSGGGGGAASGAGPPTDPTSWGLTISGFYYVAMRRQTCEIHGLYYDQGSLPFQVLELRPEGGSGGGAGNSPGSPASVGGPGVKARFPAQQFR